LGRYRIGEQGYMDMSVSVGRQGIDFDSNEMNPLSEENIGYEYKAMYVGGHIGYGYKSEETEKLNIEIIGKVLLMRQEGKEEKLSNGMPVEFEGTMSGKIKGLVKAGYKCNEKVVPYVGVGYEYEFLGKAKGKVEGVEMKEIDLKGGSGIGEIGVRSEMGDININISGRGYIGEREGVEGMLKVGYAI
jgi:outer membrane autotransporter protein